MILEGFLSRFFKGTLSDLKGLESKAAHPEPCTPEAQSHAQHTKTAAFGGVRDSTKGAAVVLQEL